MRLIDADALFRAMEETGWYNNADRDEIAEELVLKAPTIDPERKNDLFPVESTMECNRCHEHQPITIDDNLCPNCGAEMQKGEGDDEN